MLCGQHIVRHFQTIHALVVGVHIEICLASVFILHNVKIADLAAEGIVVFAYNLIRTEECVRLQYKEARLFAGELDPRDVFAGGGALADVRTIHAHLREQIGIRIVQVGRDQEPEILPVHQIL